MRQRRAHAERGFTLLVVLVVLTLITTVLLVTLRGSVSQLQAEAIQRDRNLVQASADQGLTLAMNWLSVRDGAYLLDIDEVGSPAGQFDIFNNWAGAATLVPPALYPPVGTDHAGAFEILVGAARGQVTRAPAGEDVRTSYGQIIEVQVNVRSNPAIVERPLAEQRYEVGVRVTRTLAHATP